MDEELWPDFDNNSSEALENVTLSSTAALPPSSTLSPFVVAAVGLVVTAIGSCGNSVVLVILIRARREFGSSVHTLITSQTIIDLFGCVTGLITLIMMIAHGYKYNGNKIVDGTICVTLEVGSTKMHNV